MNFDPDNDDYDHQIQQEVFTEDDFYGLNVIDCPPEQTDDEFQYLHEKDKQEILIAASNRNDDSPIVWTDCLISDEDVDVEFVLDKSISDSWSDFIEEVKHVRATLFGMLKRGENDENREVSLSELIDLALGVNSAFYHVFCKEVDISGPLTYYKFFATLCLQMGYRESPSCLYDESSQLEDKVIMEESDYIGI